MRTVHRVSSLFYAILSCASAGAQAISPDHPEQLQQGILAAYAAGQKTVVVPAGVYQIPQPANGFSLVFANLTNFEIDARGASFVFLGPPGTGVYFENCESVTLRGATLYYATVPFSQAVIQAIPPDRSYLDVQIEKGYPTNLDDTKYFSSQLITHLFDSSTRAWKRTAYIDIIGIKTQRLGPDTFRIFTNSAAGAAVGDLLAIRCGTGDHLIRVNNSAGMNLLDLTILNSPNFAVSENFDKDLELGPNHYSGIVIKRGARPAGAVTDPLFSTNADGFHSITARKGPLVENCNFEWMGDDGIAVHGAYSWVMEASANTLIVSNTRFRGANFRVGDPLRLVDTSNSPGEEAIVTGIVALPNYHNSRKSARSTLDDFTVGPYYQITLDHAVKADFDYLASNPSASGSGFTLQNNTIKNHRGRGIIVQSDSGTITGNLIDGSTWTGIRIGPEFFWSSAGYSRNMLIRNNTIRHVAVNISNGALVVAADQGDLTTGGFQNIVIDGNTFDSFDSVAIFVASAAGVTISNNHFVNLLNAAPVLYYGLGENVNPGTLIFVTKSSSVQVQENTTSQSGSSYGSFIQAAGGTTLYGIPYLVADSIADFSSTQGGRNWFYGYLPLGDVNAFTPLTYNSQDLSWEHSSSGSLPTFVASINARPSGSESAEEWATRRWISPYTGAATISLHMAKVNTSPAGDGVFGRIYLNRNLVYERFLPTTDSTGFDYSFPATLSLGDMLDFALGPNQNAYFDQSQFSASVTWSVPASAAGLTPLSVSPPAVTTTNQPTKYTFAFNDPAGFQDIGVANILINSSLDGRTACYVALVPKDGTTWSLFLVDNAGDAGGPYAGTVIPGSSSISNGQCTINAAGSSVTGSGTTLAVVLAISFDTSFWGDRVIYLANQSKAGINSNWHAKGVVRVGGSPALNTSVVGMTPSRAYVSTAAAPLTFTFSDIKGAADIGVANILINRSLDGRNACYLAFAHQIHTLYVVNDAGTALLPGQSLVSSGTLSNSQCTVSWGPSAVTVSGNNVTLALNFAAGVGFSGADLVSYAAVRDKNEDNNTGWHAVGTQTGQ